MADRALAAFFLSAARQPSDVVEARIMALLYLTVPDANVCDFANETGPSKTDLNQPLLVDLANEAGPPPFPDIHKEYPKLLSNRAVYLCFSAPAGSATLRAMAANPEALRARAAKLRDRAAELHRVAQRVTDRKMLDAYTALIAEYDALALELEQMAGEITA
jgi:hypothetical protein